jgi:hypothetical protein
MLDCCGKSVTEAGLLIYRFSIIQVPSTQINFFQYRRNINFSVDSIVNNFFYLHFLPDGAINNRLAEIVFFRTEKRRIRENLRPDLRYI